MSRRRNSMLDAIEAFNAAYKTTTNVGRDLAMARVTNARPETLQGFTQADGDTLRQAAESGQYEIGTEADEQGNFTGYTITPKADPAQVGRIAQRPMTEFLGQRTEGVKNQDQIDRARMGAMAGVLERFDPQEGMRMRRELRTQDRDDERWTQQQRQWGVENRRNDRLEVREQQEDAFRAGRQQAMANTVFGRRQAEHQQAMAAFQADAAAWEAKPPEQRVGPAPSAPVAPAYSISESLADAGAMLQFDAQHGRADPKQLQEWAGRMELVRREGLTNALRLAQNGAPIVDVVKAFNASGNERIDARNIVSDQIVAGPGGAPTRRIQYRLPNGQVNTIDTLTELENLGAAERVFDLFFKGRQDERSAAQLRLSEQAGQRAANADARAARNAAQTDREEAGKRQAAADLFREQNPNATPAQIAAVAAGVMPAVPAAQRTVAQSRAIVDDYKHFSQPRGGFTPSEAEISQQMVRIHGPNWEARMLEAGGGQPAPAPTATPAPAATPAARGAPFRQDGQIVYRPIRSPQELEAFRREFPAATHFRDGEGNWRAIR